VSRARRSSSYTSLLSTLTSSSIMAGIGDLQTLLNALEVFNQAPDKTAIARANAYLLDFQHSV
jgi:hypothetical protein